MSPVGVSVSDVVDELRGPAHERLGVVDGEAFLARLTQSLPQAVRTLDEIYGARTDLSAFIRSLSADLLDHASRRDGSLRELDRQREADPGWFQDPRMIGYVCYADRFGGTLDGVRDRLGYLGELGVSYLHLMPVLAARNGENDGGYAVVDYDAVDPRLGTMADLTELADELHRRGVALCVDLVLNHTAREHEWARQAIAGAARYRDFYLIYPDRVEPDAYERSLPEIFPEMAPGSFTHVPELGGWVWTTFREFQWDLNYANPDVFQAMLATMLRLANHGADVLRLDAAPFLWKRLGTDCQNQPETHLLLQAFRALTSIAAPGLLLKAEAMVGPDILGQYLGDHETYRRECDLAYDNQLMVMLWSTLASGDSTLARQALTRRRPAPAATSWVTYVRSHDDIGWAVADADAAAVGLDGATHRRHLSDFYCGAVPGSFARGARFQHNALGEAPTSGTTASLCGIEAALAGGDSGELELGLRRFGCLYSIAFSFGGIPLIYMGDELALRNDPHWAAEPAHHDDNRWMHRPRMDWSAADRRADLATVEGRAFAVLRSLGAARAAAPALRSNAETTIFATGDPALFAYRRHAPGTPPLLAVANLGERPQLVGSDLLRAAGIDEPEHVHSSSGSLTLGADGFELAGYGFVWIRQAR